MSETTITRRPLWKQLTGALAGAAIAFVLYQGYGIAADHLVAAVPMGPAAGAVAGSPTSASAEATGGRPGPFVDAIGRLWPGEPWYTFASSASSPSSSDSSSSQSSENRVFYGPFGSIRSLRKYFQPLPSGSSSSTAASVTTAAGAAPLAGTQATGFSSSSLTYVTVVARSSSQSSRDSATQIGTASSSWSEAFPVAAPETADVPLEPIVELTAPAPRPAIVMDATVTASKNALPKSGFGLDVLAVMALGAVAGGRWKKKR